MANIDDLKVDERFYWVTKTHDVKSGVLKRIIVDHNGKHFRIRSDDKWDDRDVDLDDCWLSHSKDDAYIFAIDCMLEYIRKDVFEKCKTMRELRQQRKDLRSEQLVKQLAGLPKEGI